MLDARVIREAVRRVVAAASTPRRVFLFNSYARGDATDRSDVDLLVVERKQFGQIPAIFLETNNVRKSHAPLRQSMGV